MNYNMSRRSRLQWPLTRRIPYPGRRIIYDPQFDASEDRVPDDLDFAALKRLLDDADDGDAEAMLSLNETMEARDAHLRRVAETRRCGLTAMEWTIDPLESVTREADQGLAETAADYLRNELANCPTFDLLLRNMAQAIGPNLSATEVEWEGVRPMAFHPVRINRLVIKRQTSDAILVKDADHQDGVAPPPYKMICHIPDDLGAFIFTNTTARAQAPLWGLKKLAQRNWGIFTEVFGMPLRVASYGPTATAADKAAAAASLEAMGARAWALLSKDIEYEIHEATRGTEPYSSMIEWIQREQAIGYLGQNLTTDTTGSGGLGGAGAAAIHADVKRLITEGDATAEERTLRTTLFSWMLSFQFPNQWPYVPIPRFRRVFREYTAPDVLAEVIRKAVQDIGLPVPQAWALRTLKIPEAAEGETIVKPMTSIGFR